MQTLEGVVGRVGAGSWEDGGGGGKTILSVFEIGDHHLKRVVLPDFLRNYIVPGEPARVMVGQGLSRGLITRPFIAAVEVNGKKYKTDSVLLMAVCKIILYSMVIGGILAGFSKVLALVAVVGITVFYVRDYLELKAW
ncbi:MAG: hypothetical protein ABJC74_16245 [Gemmatimonadota bacterium]